MSDGRILLAIALLCGGVAQAADAPPGAVACAGCHPARPGVDTSVTRLVGRDAGEIAAAFRAYRTGPAQGTIMGRIAKGFNDDEVTAIAAWYAARPGGDGR